MKKMKRVIVAGVISAMCSGSIMAHTVSLPVTSEDLDTIREKVSALSRVHLGGYGEAVYNYDFSATRVSNSEALYEDSRGHSSIDIPRIVLMLGVNLGKGWGVETDVAFENGKNVCIDQFWIEKLFRKEAGLKAGYLTLPVGLYNSHDDPMEFFSVNRPIDEDAILPCKWHQTGLSFFGETGAWSYEAVVMPGINSSMFTEEQWLALDEAGANFNYSKGNSISLAGRVENSSVEGLRMALSGYWGTSFNNRLAFIDGLQRNIRGNIGLLSVDFLYDNYGWLLRGNGTWGRYSKNVKSKGAVEDVNEHYKGSKSAFAASFEGGYDIFSLTRLKETEQKFYIFSRYDYYQPAEADGSFLGYDWSHRQRVGAGINYFPIDRVVLKAEYSHTFLPGGKGIPMLSLGVAFSGQFF